MRLSLSNRFSDCVSTRYSAEAVPFLLVFADSHHTPGAGTINEQHEDRVSRAVAACSSTQTQGVQSALLCFVASLSLMIIGPQPREPKCPTYLPAPTQFYFDATIARKGDSSIQTGSAWDGRAVTVATAPTVLNIGLGWAKIGSVQPTYTGTAGAPGRHS